MLQKKYIDARQAAEIELIEIPGRIKHLEGIVSNCEADILYLSENKREYDKDQRKSVRKTIFNAISEGELSVKEKTVCFYRGFEVIIPSNMIISKPYVYLRKNGKYRVDMGFSEAGVLTRIDNFLDEADKYLNELRENLSKLKKREKDIKIELNKDENYSEEIESLRKKLSDIDRKLGVK